MHRILLCMFHDLLKCCTSVGCKSTTTPPNLWPIHPNIVQIYHQMKLLMNIEPKKREKNRIAEMFKWHCRSAELQPPTKWLSVDWFWTKLVGNDDKLGQSAVDYLTLENLRPNCSNVDKLVPVLSKNKSIYSVNFWFSSWIIIFRSWRSTQPHQVSCVQNEWQVKVIHW